MSTDTGQKWLAGSEIGRSGREVDLRQTARGESLAMLTLRELARNPGAVIGGLMLAVIVLAALLHHSLPRLTRFHCHQWNLPCPRHPPIGWARTSSVATSSAG